MKLVTCLIILITFLSFFTLNYCEENSNEANTNEETQVIDENQSPVQEQPFEQELKENNDDDRLEKALSVLVKQPSDSRINEAFATLRSLANENSDTALFELGKIYMEGELVDRNLSMAHEYFESASSLGNPEAQFELGFMYSHGLVVPRDEGKGILYYTASSMGGNINSMMALGYRKLHGYGVERSCWSAAHHYKQAASFAIEHHGNSMVPIDSTRINEFEKLRVKQNQEEVMDYYEYSAVKGDGMAQLVLGWANLYGVRGLQEDHVVARQYFQQAAQNGEAGAYGALGQIYAQGLGVAVDNRTAFEYYTKGASAGDYTSYNGLGYFHMYGLGGAKKDMELALKYFTKAAVDGDNPEAQYNLAILYLHGTDIDQDTKKAADFMKRAARQGQLFAMYHLGEMHAEGTGVTQSCLLAVRFFKRVAERGPIGLDMSRALDEYTEGDHTSALLKYVYLAEQGYSVAQNNAAFMYDSGLGLDAIQEVSDHQQRYQLPVQTHDRFGEALHWYMHSAQQGHIQSFVKVGDSFYYGKGIEINYGKSIKYYRRAADLNHPQASFNLGYMYQYGKGLAQDFHLAKRFYDRARNADPIATVPSVMALVALFLHSVIAYLNGSTATPLFLISSSSSDSIFRWDSILSILGSTASKGPGSSSKDNDDDESSADLLDEIAEIDDLLITALVGLLIALIFLRYGLRRRQQRFQQEQQH
eukprot:gb/GECH01008790.1/.p1 GENE.gb/GECH01008790.1/~~gb/GECH01008790.1/.p1  ORF type:complete len:704 (+),score=167.66 gb/GECH01008790.1/:1-2112(+)